MKPLPVPPLRQSLDRYFAALTPLLDAGELQEAKRILEEFAQSDGPACQAALERVADDENVAGRSWLSTEWLSGYLRNRDPLPLTSSVGFRFQWADGPNGPARVADAIHRIAGVHLAHLRGEIPAETTPRGDVVDMSQWRVLAGGIRHPQAQEDVFLSGQTQPDSREIVLLCGGRAHFFPISDGDGRSPSPEAIERAVQGVAGHATPSDNAFTHLSYLGSDLASAYLDTLLQERSNAQNYQRLRNALFVVNLIEAPATEEQHQERVTFGLGNAWAHKPITYQLGLADGYVGAHVEHSIIDGATLRAIVALMQNTEPTVGRSFSGPVPVPEPFSWNMPPNVGERLALDVAQYSQRASVHRVLIMTVASPETDGLAMRVSHDALMQFGLLYAQLAAYGRARSTYEAVDMREYQAGRTECLRPVTAAALHLAQRLHHGDATANDLHDALAAHKEQVMARKTGQGFDRHLLGLRLMAGRLGLRPGLFESESYVHLSTDFLSTSSVGANEHLVRFSFAPTSPGGLGINYTAAGDNYEFVVTHVDGETENIDAFTDALTDGISALAELLDLVREG